jgi:UPF0271 protein
MSDARHIDLNADLGEGYGPWAMGEDADMLGIVTSANIACGGHASDPETMYRTVVQSRDNGVTVGAHPGYADRPGFGRRVIPMSADEITRMVAAQIGSLMGVAALAGVPVRYVKAHGALANLAAAEPEVATAVASAVAAVSGDLSLLAISGTALESAGKAAGLTVFSEVFADRAYLSNGQLQPRSQPGAVIHDVEFAAKRLLTLLQTGEMPSVDGRPVRLAAQSICVHGDSPGALAMAQGVRAALVRSGVVLSPFLSARP